MDRIIKILRENGPITGKYLLEKSGEDALALWRICNRSDNIIIKKVGKRYLRLDRRIEGYARLSPSILREFLTYTIIGLNTDLNNVIKKTNALAGKVEKISRDKLILSKEVVSRLVTEQKSFKEIKLKATFIIAGDVVYNMAHSELRPERSTEQMVRGSDLDIVIITEGLPDDILQELDRSIYHEKYFLLKMPAYHEEIDYVIKDINKVKEQADFNRFEFMVASKILHEGIFLYGSIQIFEKVKKLLQEKEIPRKLEELEKIAITEREIAENYLLNNASSLSGEEYKKLFYTTEEKEEIF